MRVKLFLQMTLKVDVMALNDVVKELLVTAKFARIDLLSAPIESLVVAKCFEIVH